MDTLLQIIKCILITTVSGRIMKYYNNSTPFLSFAMINSFLHHQILYKTVRSSLKIISSYIDFIVLLHKHVFFSMYWHRQTFRCTVHLFYFDKLTKYLKIKVKQIGMTLK